MTQDDTLHTYCMQPRQFNCSLGRLGYPRPPKKKRNSDTKRYNVSGALGTSQRLVPCHYTGVTCQYCVSCICSHHQRYRLALQLRRKIIPHTPTSPSMYRLTGITDQHKVWTALIWSILQPRCSSGKRGHYQPSTLCNTIT